MRGRPELAELHAALALAELGRCPPGFTLPSGAPYSILAGPPPTSPLDWACTLDFPAEVVGLLDPDTSGVAALAFTPDGRYLVSAGGLRPQLWDLQVLRAPAAAAARVLDHSLFTQQEGTAHPVPKPAGEASEVR